MTKTKNENTFEKGLFRVLSVDKKNGELLSDIGIIEGCEVEILGRSPMKGPILVRIGPSTFALRADELAGIIFESK